MHPMDEWGIRPLAAVRRMQRGAEQHSAPVVVVLGKADNQTAFPYRLKPSS